MKYFFLLPLLMLFIIPSVLADSCTPEAGYIFCYEQTNTYASASSTARIQASDINNFLATISDNGQAVNLYLKEASFYYKADNTAYVSNLFNAISQNACSSNGCIATEITPIGKVTLAASGQEYSSPISIIAFSCSGDCGRNSSLTPWAWSAVNWFWDNKTYRAVDCYYNSNCGVGLYCDTSGDWRNWKCLPEQCSVEQTKCIGTDYYVCSVNNAVSGPASEYVNQGKINGKCGWTETTQPAEINITFTQSEIPKATDNLYLILGIIAVVIFVLLWMGRSK